MMAAIAIVMISDSVCAEPIVLGGGPASTGFLYGIGYREQELQQAKSTTFNAETPSGVGYASYAGYTNIFIEGHDFAKDPDANFIVLESSDFEGQKFIAPQLTLDDSFQSNTAAGLLSYRLPSIEKIFGLPQESFENFNSLTFTLSIRAMKGENFIETFTCKVTSNCRIVYRRDSSPRLYYISPSVVFNGMVTQFHFNPRYVPNLVKGLLDDELPIINAKIGLGRLDFEGWITNNEYINDWSTDEVRGEIAEDQLVSKDNSINLQWETGASQVSSVQSVTCSFDGSDCYKARVLPMISQVSESQGYLTGGQEITIKGMGFNHGTVATEIDGVACTEVRKSDTEFVCKTGSKSTASDTTSDKAGQNGLKKTLITSSAWATYQKDQSKTPANITLTTNTEFQKDIGSNIAQGVQGWFVPPMTGNYRFYMACDDYCYMKLGTATPDVYDEDQMVKLLERRGAVGYRDYWRKWFNPTSYSSTTQFHSEWVALESGKKYYLDHGYWEGGGGDHSTLSVEIEKSGTANHPNAMKEMQKLTMHGSAQVYEQTYVEIRGPTGSNIRTKITDPSTGDVVQSDTFRDNLSGWDFNKKVRSYFNKRGISIDVWRTDTVDDGVTVYTYKIQLRKLLASDSYSSFIVQKAGSGATITVTTPQDNASYKSSLPLTGTFKVKCFGPDGKEGLTDALDVNSHVNTVISAIQNLPECPLYDRWQMQDDWSCKSPADCKSWWIRFRDINKDMPQFEIVQDSSMTVVESGTTTPPTITATTLHDFGTNLMYEPIPFEMLQTYETSPQITMTVGDLPAACKNFNCDYAYIDAVGDITSFTWNSGTSELSISGTDLPAKDDILSISFGNTLCGEVTSSSTSITCKTDYVDTSKVTVEAGSHKPIVRVKQGAIKVTAAASLVSGSFSSISPKTEINPLGNDLLTITGTNLPNSMDVVASVKFTVKAGQTGIQADENVDCEIQSTSATSMTCKTSAFNIANSGFIYEPTITVAGDILTNTNNEEITLTASVSQAISIDNSDASPVLDTELIITLDGSFETAKIVADQFDLTLTDKSDATNIKKLRVFEVDTSAKTLKAMFNGAHSGTYAWSIKHSELGEIKVTALGDFEVKSEITSFTPDTGSIYGGTLITISGNNFGNVKTDNPVQIKMGITAVDCFVLTTSRFTITCRVDDSEFALKKIEDAKAESISALLIVFLKTSEEATCLVGGGCGFTFTDSLPEVTAIESAVVSSVIEVTVTGTSFGTSTSTTVMKAGDKDLTTVSVSATSAVFQVQDSTDLQNLSDLKDSLKLYFEAGVPKGNSFITGGVTQDPSFESVSLAVGSKGGSIVYAKVVGIGLNDDVSKLVLSDETTLCDRIDVISYGYVRCYTKSFKKSSMDVSIRFGGTDYACGAITSVTSNCQYEATDTSMPIVTGVSITAPTTVKVDGTDFFTSSYTAKVTYGGVVSSSVSINSATELVATFDLGVPIVRVGAKPDVMFESDATTTYNTRVVQSTTHFAYNEDVEMTNLYAALSTPSSTTCSFKGGCLYDIPASGLTNTLSNLPTKNYIEVCGKRCEISTSDSSQSNAKCTLPQISTLYSDRELKVSQESNDLKGYKVFGSGSDDAANAIAFDDDLTQKFEPPSNECHIGVEFKEFHVGLLSEVKYLYVTIPNKNNVANKAVFEGSMDGVTYTELFAVEDNVREGWNYKTLSTPSEYYQYRFYRFKGTHREACQFGEIKFKGVETINDNNADYNCPANVVIDGEVAQTYDAAVEFKSTLTPTLTSISPKYGTVAGGTSVTFTGTGFSSTPSDVTVTIDGVDCPVSSSTSTSIVCTTGNRPGTPDPTLTITIANKGNVATQGLRYTYGRYWSDINTWGGGFPPIDGDSLTVAKGVNMIVDIDTSPQLQALFVFGSLIFLPDSDPNHHRTFDARYIFVDHGRMEVGTEEDPYTSKITITLHGKIDDPYLPIYGNKVLGVRHATLDMHGIKREPTWTLMKTTADVGATQIQLDAKVDWVAGDVIAIASTSFDPREAEKRTITEVDNSDVNAPIIKFSDSLEYKHFAKIQTFGTDTIDTRAEVGLLSRNVVFRGDPETSVENEYGATIFIHSAGDDSVVARLSYIECTHVGQASQLGRYAIHFHMIGAIHKSYVKGLGLHQGNNRAFTIHGNSHLRIIDNTVFDVKGHTVFIEDGAETKNYIENNLIMMTKRSMSLLNTDQTPACFWITNPDNQFINNRAAGSDRYGFWFDLQINPTGPSADPNYCPINDKLGEFRGNHAHSMGRYGLRVFHGHVPRKFPCKPVSYDYNNPEDPYHQNPLVTANYVDFTGWKCNRNGAITGDVGDVRLINFKVADNILAGLEYEKVVDVKDNKAQIIDALVIGRSENTEPLLDAASPHGIITPRSEYFTINGAKFYNLDFNSASGIGSCSHCFHPAATDSGARTVTTKGLVFDSTVPRKLRYQFPFNGIILDRDGSLTGLGTNTYAAAYHRHLEVPECTKDIDVFDGVVCDKTVQIRRLAYYSATPSNRFTGMKMKILNYDDDLLPTDEAELETYLKDKSRYSSVQWKEKNPSANWATPFVTGHKYKVSWGETGLDWENLKLDMSERWRNTDKPIYMVHNFTDQRHRIKVFHAGQQVENNTLPADWDPSGDTMYDTGLNLIINGSMEDPTAGLIKEVPAEGEEAVEEAPETASEQGSRFVKYIISPKDRNDKNLWSDKFMRFEGTRCLYNCNPPPPPDVVVEMVDKYWSDDSIWSELESGKRPSTNDDLTVPPEWNLIIDVAKTPVMGKITVFGGITFNDNESLKDVELRAKIIFIRGGILQIGTEEQPFQQNAKITLYGKRNEDPIAMSDEYEAGNKIIANLGTVKLYGKKRAQKMTRLHAEAKKGATTVTLGTELDIVKGDKLAFAPTAFAQTAGDVKTVSSYDSETGKTVLTSGLSFYHYGAEKSSADSYNGVDIRGEVVILSRNIKIEGTSEDNWGAQLVTGDASEFVGETEVLRKGQLIMNNVEMFRCSQADSVACLRFESSKSKPSIVKGSTFYLGKFHGASIVKSDYIVLEDNIWFDFTPIGVRWDYSNFIRFANNFVGLIKKRTTFTAQKTLDKEGGVIACSYEVDKQTGCTDNSIVNNIVAGAKYAGFVAPGHDCGDYTTEYFKDNVAHSVDGVGHAVYPNPGIPKHATCYEASNMAAYKVLREGLWGCFITSRFQASKITMLDNKLGMVLQSVDGDDATGENHLEDAMIYGETESPDCPPGGGFCHKINKFGLQSSTITHNGPKDHLIVSKPNYPHSIIHGGEAAWNAKTTNKNIKFFNFNDKTREGMRQRVFGFTVTMPDYFPAQEFDDVTFTNVEDGALIQFFEPPTKWANIADCGDFPCTGPLNTMYMIKDAKFEGDIKPLISLPSFYLIPNNEAVAQKLSISCLKKLDYGGYLCADFKKLGILMFESLDDDRRDRSMQPVYISQNGQSERNKLNSFMDQCWDGFYTCQIRLSRFPALIETDDATTLIKFTGSPAQHYRFKLVTARKGATIVSINYPNSKTYGVYHNGKHIAQNNFDPKTEISDPISKTKCGENTYSPISTILEFYIDEACILEIKPRNVIQAKVRMQWDLNSFFEDGGTTTFADRLAGSLGIHASTIKVVGVYEGSVICDYEISPDEDDTKTEDQKLAELAAINDKQTELFTKPDQLSLGGSLLDASIGGTGEETPILQGGVPQITYTSFSNTLSCSRCIKGNYVYVYNYDMIKPSDFVEQDFTKPPEEETTDDTTSDTTADTSDETVEEPVVVPPELHTYVDLLTDDAAPKGWCCEKAGSVGVLCGTRNIGGSSRGLVPDSWTPTSAKFSSDDLAMVACPQRVDNCGQRNHTMAKDNTPVVLTGKALSKNDVCSWIVKVECGLPVIKVLEKAASITDSNTRLTYVEWQNAPSLLVEQEEDQWAPHSKTQIPKVFKQWEETIGTISKVTFETNSYTIDDVETNVKAYNKLVNTYVSQISSFNSKVDDYNNAADAKYEQYKLWDTYTWFDKIFTGEDDVVTEVIPSKPSKPTPPAPSTNPDLSQIKFSKGGAGSPQAGEISLDNAHIGQYKYFGVLGQQSELADVGFTAQADKGSTCKPKYVALNVHVHDDSGVSATDEIKIEISVQTKMNGKELDFKSLPSPPNPSYRGDPQAKFEAEQAAGAQYMMASILVVFASILAYF